MELLEQVFKEWYGVSPGDFGFYWDMAISDLVKSGFLEEK